MRPRFDYTALRDIPIKDNYGFAYREGDDITASAVDNLRELGYTLVVGEDIVPARDDVIARPKDSATVAEWRDYAVGQGKARAEVEELKRDELIEMFPDPDAKPAKKAAAPAAAKAKESAGAPTGG